jgi:hypothetical protein
MLNRHDLQKPVEEAIRAHGGSASLVQVCKHIWENYEADLQRSGDLLYTWQYEVRHAASLLRKAGLMKAADVSPKGIWELA